jgi:Fe-S-cluster containining protein
MRTSCLSIHAAYACEHSGACCRAPWPIPLEEAQVWRLRAQGLVPETGSLPVRPLESPVNGMTLRLATGGNGACVFFDAEGGRLCRIHRQAGPDMLPSTCRAFPRIALRDARGLLITLSHYCPTAARLLLNAGDILIVHAPASLSLGGEIGGLDATAVLPPLLRPGMLMDLEGYAKWEQEAIAVLNDGLLTAQDAVGVIRAATRDTCQWQPGVETLAEQASRAFVRARAGVPQRGASALADAPADRRRLGGGWSAPRRDRAAGVSRLEHATKAFIAAHLFASWAAYQEGGLCAVVDAVEAALALVGTGHADDESFLSTVRAADLRLRHG